jgi:fatty acid synthase subunit alpha
MQYHIDQCDESKGETYRLAKELGQQLLENCREALAENPLYKDGMSSSTPHEQVRCR